MHSVPEESSEIGSDTDCHLLFVNKTENAHPATITETTAIKKVDLNRFEIT